MAAVVIQLAAEGWWTDINGNRCGGGEARAHAGHSVLTILHRTTLETENDLLFKNCLWRCETMSDEHDYICTWTQTRKRINTVVVWTTLRERHIDEGKNRFEFKMIININRRTKINDSLTARRGDDTTRENCTRTIWLIIYYDRYEKKKQWNIT